LFRPRSVFEGANRSRPCDAGALFNRLRRRQLLPLSVGSKRELAGYLCFSGKYCSATRGHAGGARCIGQRAGRQSSPVIRAQSRTGCDSRPRRATSLRFPRNEMERSGARRAATQTRMRVSTTAIERWRAALWLHRASLLAMTGRAVFFLARSSDPPPQIYFCRRRYLARRDQAAIRASFRIALHPHSLELKGHGGGGAGIDTKGGRTRLREKFPRLDSPH